jgi:hypothetical protein
MDEQQQFERVSELFRNSPAERVGPPIRQRMWERALESSLNFVEQHGEHALLFDARSQLHAYALSKVPKEGLILEFGVFRGDSINALADALQLQEDTRPLYGFDSFEGLEEDWAGHECLAGTFDLQGKLPPVRERVRLVAGWIDKTLPPFLSEHPDPIALLHVDTDTYTPCKLILSLVQDRLRPGSVVIFDELLAYPGWQVGEYKALCETMTKPYRFIAFSGHHAAMVIE